MQIVKTAKIRKKVEKLSEIEKTSLNIRENTEIQKQQNLQRNVYGKDVNLAIHCFVKF